MVHQTLPLQSVGTNDADVGLSEPFVLLGPESPGGLTHPRFGPEPPEFGFPEPMTPSAAEKRAPRRSFIGYPMRLLPSGPKGSGVAGKRKLCYNGGNTAVSRSKGGNT